MILRISSFRVLSRCSALNRRLVVLCNEGNEAAAIFLSAYKGGMRRDKFDVTNYVLSSHLADKGMHVKCSIKWPSLVSEKCGIDAKLFN